MIIYNVISVFIAFIGGLALGYLYLSLLRASVRSITQDHRANLGVVLTIARLGFVAAGLWAAVQFGGLALLGTLAGFTVMRVIGTQPARGSTWT